MKKLLLVLIIVALVWFFLKWVKEFKPKDAFQFERVGEKRLERLSK
jgi:hypothetical protein